MAQVEKELNAIGFQAPKKEFEAIKKLVKKKEKKAKNHVKYIADTMYLEGYEMNAFDEENMFLAKHGRDKDKEDDKDDEEVVLPAVLVYGVTMTLCGLFLMVLPIPVCKEWGSKMMFAGVTTCAGCICSHIDEDKKKEIRISDESSGHINKKYHQLLRRLSATNCLTSCGTLGKRRISSWFTRNGCFSGFYSVVLYQ
jgi:hypothetical protein